MSDSDIHTEAARPPLWLRVWRHPLVALVVAVALVIATSVALSFGFSRLPDSLTDAGGGALPAVVSVVVIFALYKLAIRKLGSRKHDDLPLSGSAKDLALGIGGGALIIAVVAGVAALAGVYRVVGWGGSEGFGMILFQAGVTAGFVEELIFRGILFRWLEEFGGSWAALALSAALFGLLHISNPAATVFSSVAIAIEAGILLGAAYMFTRSLWFAVGIHFGWNVTQGYIFDVPVSGHPVRGLVEAELSGPEWLSGGAFGLEASVIALVVCTGAGLWLLRKAIQKGELMRPSWRR